MRSERLTMFCTMGSIRKIKKTRTFFISKAPLAHRNAISFDRTVLPMPGAPSIAMVADDLSSELSKEVNISAISFPGFLFCREASFQ